MLTPAVAGADTLADPDSPTAVESAATADSDFAAYSSGDQETPPNDSPAWGYAVFDLGADGSILTYSGRAFGLFNPSDAHLHLAPPGVAGPIVVPLMVPGQPGSSGCVNVATGETFERTGTATSGPVSGCESVFPSGTATSATFRPADKPCRQLVDGSSDASGLCGFADISGTITAANLTGPLAGRTMSDLVAAIRAGDIYINLHTRQFPAGEIRGQLIGQS
jgi:CHRD domain